VCNYELGKGTDECKAVVIPECSPGYVPVQSNPGECVPSYECYCNTSRNPCPEKPVCGELEHVVTTQGECCPIHKCGRLHLMKSIAQGCLVANMRYTPPHNLSVSRGQLVKDIASGGCGCLCLLLCVFIADALSVTNHTCCWWPLSTRRGGGRLLPVNLENKLHMAMKRSYDWFPEFWTAMLFINF